jgi:hypothetical protein
MKPKQSSPSKLGHKTWVAIRFVIFGIGGAMVMLFFLFDSAEGRVRNLTLTSPLPSLLLVFAAAISMLFGTGAWGDGHVCGYGFSFSLLRHCSGATQ